MSTITTAHATYRPAKQPGAGPISWILRAFAVRAQRERLGKLDDRLLRDIGVDHRLARNEAQRPFWDLPR